MSDQTVALKLEGDSSDLQAAVNASAETFDALAGQATEAAADVDAALTGMSESAEEAGGAVRDLDDELNVLTDGDRLIELALESAEAEERIAEIDALLSDPSLTEAEINVLVDARNEVSQRLEELQGEVAEFGVSIEDSAGFWEAHEDGINRVGAAMAVAGAAAEGFARKQAPLNEQTQRIAASLGVTDDTIRDLAMSLTNVTRPLEQVLETMEIGRQQGLRTTEQLADFAAMWDTVGDATGENAADLARSSASLRAVGLGVEDVSQAYSAFGFIQENTTIRVGEFMETINKIGPEIRTMNLSIDDAAAVIGAMQGELGATGRVARREFQSAVREADGDLNVMLETLGLSTGQFEAYRGQVAESSHVIERNAEIHGESYTVVQKLQHEVETLMYRFGGLAEGASMLAPVLMGGGGVVVALNQLKQLSPAVAGHMSNLAGNMGKLARGAGALAIAGIAVERTINAWSTAMSDAKSDAEDFVDTFTRTSIRPVESLGELHDEIMRVGGAAAEMKRHGDEALNPFLKARYREAEAGLILTREALLEAEEAASHFQRELGVSADEAARMATNNEIMAAAVDEATGEIDAGAATRQQAAQEYAELEESIRGVVSAMHAQFDPFWAAEDAMRRHHDAQQAVTEAEWALMAAWHEREQAAKEHGRGSIEAMEATARLQRAEQDLQDANRNTVRTARDVAGAQYQLKRMMEEGDLTTRDAIITLRNWVAQGLLTEEQAHQAAVGLGIMADKARDADGIIIEIPVELEGFERVIFQLDELARRARTPLIHTSSVVARDRAIAHEGGRLPGAFGEEIDLRALGGEYVIRGEAAQVIGYDVLDQLNQADRMSAVSAGTAVAAPAVAGGAAGPSIHAEYQIVAGSVREGLAEAKAHHRQIELAHI